MPATLPELDPPAVEAAAPRKPAGLLRRILSMRFLVISIAVHLLLGLFAAIWVVQTYSANRKLTFKGGPPSPNRSTRALEHKVQMAKKQSTMSAPSTKRIVTTGLSKVALPDMPAMPKAATVPSKMAGAGGANVAPAAGPMGAASSAAGGGLVSLFGLREAGGGALMGTFFDLKQDRNGKPTDMAGADEKKANDAYFQTMQRFAQAGFSEGAVGNFFKAPNPLFTTQIFIPIIDAQDGPKAFSLQDKVKPKRWFIVYRGKVSPAESGKYRFVGAGDDMLVVRFNGAIVLSTSTMEKGSLVPIPQGSQKQYKMDGGQPMPLEAGQIIDVTAGSSYPIEVLIGEQPGGQFEGWLLLEKEGAQYDKDGNGSPKLPIFKLAKSDPPPSKGKSPVFAPDTSWSIWKAERQAAKVPGLDGLKAP